jgi:hypothetical protein
MVFGAFNFCSVTHLTTFNTQHQAETALILGIPLGKKKIPPIAEGWIAESVLALKAKSRNININISNSRNSNHQSF